MKRIFHLFRIDHVLGFYRIYSFPWRPTRNKQFLALDWNEMLGRTEGRAPHFAPRDDSTPENCEANRREGEEYLRVVLEESGSTLVIGEDLGTVPDEIRERLAAARVLSYRVLYFERWPDGAWKPPTAYPDQALAVVTTHDLPTLTGFWAGKDIEVRGNLGAYPDDQAKRAAWETRYQDKLKIWQALKKEGLLPLGLPDDLAAVPQMTPELCTALYTYLARTPSWVVLAALEDVAGEISQTNFPGTVDTYPNWSQKLTMTLEALRADPRPPQIAGSLQAVRPSKSSGSW